MLHEKFCRSYYPELIKFEDCRWCETIAAVRESVAKDVGRYLAGTPHIASVHSNRINEIILGKWKYDEQD